MRFVTRLPSANTLVLLLFSTICSEVGDAMADPFTAAGPELQVNSYTSGDQELPAVSPTAVGSYIVVWSDLSRSAVAARELDRDGVPAGTEFQISTYNTGQKNRPAVKRGESGTMFAVWSSFGQDGSFGAVIGRSLSTSGELVGTEFQINTYTTDSQYGPAIAAHPAGGFVVAWVGYGSATSTYGYHYSGADARILAADGSPLGPAFRVSDPQNYSPYGQLSAEIDALADGQFVVAWSVCDSDCDEIQASFRRLDAAVLPVGNVVASLDGPAAVVGLSDSSFVIAGAGWGGIPDYQDVYTRRFDSSGTQIGTTFLANTYTTAGQAHVSVASFESGEFIIVWMSQPGEAGTTQQDGDESGIFGQLFDGAAAKIGTEFQVNDYTTGRQRLPAVVDTGEAGFLVVWSGERGSSGTEISAKRFAAVCGDGAAILGEQCDDGNTLDGDCCSSACTFDSLGAVCEAGNLCRVGDECDGAGICNEGSLLGNCSDGNLCTDDSCAPETGCSHTNNTASCDDGDACTTLDLCSGGACNGGTAPDCDDSNLCTTDSCDNVLGCQNIANSASCDDGQYCNGSDTCADGTCSSHDGDPCSDGPQCSDSCDEAVDSCLAPQGTDCSDDSDACTQDVCDGLGSCTHATINCDDGDACNGIETCSPVMGCEAGVALDCSDGNLCTDDVCIPATGCSHAPEPPGAPCGDPGDTACDNPDTCDGGGVCRENLEPVTTECRVDAGVCDVPEFCDGVGDDCPADAFEPSHSPCDDANECTLGDRCIEGVCLSGPRRNCSLLDDGCLRGICNEATGMCITEALSDPSLCDDLNVCTFDTCDDELGCQHVAILGPCDDGDICTADDSCAGGSCVGEPIVGCGVTTTTTMPESPCGNAVPDSGATAETRAGRLITATDALAILQAAVGLSACDLCVCDVDGSGVVSAVDALAVLNHAVGNDVELRCPPCA